MAKFIKSDSIEETDGIYQNKTTAKTDEYVPNESERKLFHVAINTQLLADTGKKRFIDNWRISKYTPRDFEDTFIKEIGGLPPRGCQLGMFAYVSEAEKEKGLTVFESENNDGVLKLLYAPEK